MLVNGRIPSTSLVRLSTPGRLTKAAAASYERLNKEAGMTHGTSLALQAYRSLADQEKVFFTHYDRHYRSGRTIANGGKKYYEGAWWYRKEGHPVAAVPGTSNHGLGIAVDWDGLDGYGSVDFNTFARLAKKHGWSNTEGAKIREYWHWVYNRNNDTVLAALIAAAARKAAARLSLKKIQGYLGVPKTGLPDVATLAAWSKCPSGKPVVSTMAKIQVVLHVDNDGIKGKITKAAFSKLCATAK